MDLSRLAEDLENALSEVLRASSQSSGRQNPLAGYLLQRLRQRLPPYLWPHLKREAQVPGLARAKSWDVGLVYPEGVGLSSKPRLLFSLKSILRNPSGSWPNRLDDLVGEVSSVQMLFPEVVVGYVVVLDHGAPTKRQGGDRRPGGDELSSSYARFKAGLEALSRRRPPLWAQGLVEGYWAIEVDTRKTPILRDPLGTAQAGEVFLDALVEALRQREPLLFLRQGQ